MTCKARRVKCDETHPACHKCTSFGRTCGGYASPASPPDELKQQVSSAPFLALRETDKRAFDFFISQTAPFLAGPLDQEFWTREILQLAHVEPYVLDSILAISTLYEHPQYLREFHGQATQQGDALASRHDTPQPLDAHHASALKAYNRAIVDFRQKLNNGKASLLLALISCLLFICIEVIRDDIYQALALFTHGGNLLSQVPNHSFTKQERSLIDTISSMFGRMGVPMAAFGHPHPMDHTHEKHELGSGSTGNDAHAARNAIFAVMGDSYTFVQEATKYKSDALEDQSASSSMASLDNKYANEITGATSGNDQTSIAVSTPMSVDDRMLIMSAVDGIYGVVHSVQDCPGGTLCNCESLANPHFAQKVRDSMSVQSDEEETSYGSLPSLIIQQRELQSRLQSWRDSFLSTSHKQEALSSIMMYYHCSYIWVSTRLALDDMIFDDFTAHFEQILHHAEILLPETADAPRVFTFETGVLLPLYFTAIKCRVPSFRRRALRLMARAPRKEFMWGALSTAQLGARLIAIEEVGLGLTPPAWDGNSISTGNERTQSAICDDKLPEDDMRVRHLELMQVRATGAHEVRVTRYRKNGSLLRPLTEIYPI